MRTTLLKVTAFLALTSMFAMAQHGNPPDPEKMAQHHLDFLTKQLSLTAQQQQQATTIFSGVANNAKATHDQMRTAHDSLKAAIQKNDTAGIEQAANTIGNSYHADDLWHMPRHKLRSTRHLRPNSRPR